MHYTMHTAQRELAVRCGFFWLVTRMTMSTFSNNTKTMWRTNQCSYRTLLLRQRLAAEVQASDIRLACLGLAKWLRAVG